MDCHEITSVRGTVFTISGMISAYNEHTREAYFYLEVHRVEKKYIEDHMIGMGALSVDVDSFSPSDWESDSKKAIGSVISFGKKRGFVVLQYGVSAADNRSADNNGGGESTGGMGGRASSDEEEEERPSNDERSKRKRTASPGGREMVSLDVMMDKMAAAMSTVVSAAISSSGSDRNMEREGAKSMILMEQQRREKAESRLHDLEFKTADEVEKATKSLRDAHTIEIKAKDEQALQIETARKKLVDDLAVMRRLKVVVYFIPGVHVS